MNIKLHNKPVFCSHFLYFLSAGVQTAEEFLLFEGHPFSPAVQRCVSPEEDLGCCQQVSKQLQVTKLASLSTQSSVK